MAQPNDEELARGMQQDEIRRGQQQIPQAQPVGVFSGTGYTLSGQTYPGQQPPAYGFPSSSTAAYAPQGQAFVPGQFAASMGMPAVPEEARLMTTYSLGRAVKMLAIIDGIMLLINSFVFGFFVLLFAWGPVCGYLSSQRYQPNLALAYLVYYVLRIAFDLTMTILGVWWFIVSLLLDLFLCRYVYQYWRLLKSCSQEELAQLRAPQQQQQQFQNAPNYFRYF